MLEFFKDWGWLILLAIFGIIVCALSLGKHRNILRNLKKEKEIIDAKASARKIKARDGLEKAKAEVEKTYADKLENLDEEQKKRAEELASQPDKLVDAILRGKL